MKGKSRLQLQKATRAILFVNHKKSQARVLSDEILKELAALNIDADVYSFGGKTNPLGGKDGSLGKGFDVAISLGGDGTVLSAARVMSPLGIPIFPINLGTFGFIAEVQPLEWREVFGRWLNGKANLSRRLMLEVAVKRGEREIQQGCCLNDAIISFSGIAKIIKLHLSFGGKPGEESGSTKAGLKLMSYRSDGLIISTPTGSTAYSSAAGGPIVDPEIEAMVLSPICPFVLTQRPLLLPSNEEVIVELDEKQQSGVHLTLDGQVTTKLKRGDRVHFKKAPYSCLLIESGRKGFYKALRTKLSWADEGEQKKEPGREKSD